MLPSLQFTNSLTRKKSAFKPLNSDNITLYVCGVTPYDHAHLGHARCYVFFDVLARFLTASGFTVTYVRNYTDIEDKIITKAELSNQTIEQVASTFIKSYQEDMAVLNCIKPCIEPKVTEHIPEIIAFVEGLIARGNAYVAGHDVYFDISSHAHYGNLGGKKLDDLVAGSRVAINEVKRNPGDFALWKGNDKRQFWTSPWGFGRPGWHIECSAMAYKYFGATIDIHGGGQDLIFPHHENEIAQSESLTNKPLAQLWLHNAFININKEKMSKSLGNAINLKQLFSTINPMVLRFYFLQHHYRTPLDFDIAEFDGVKTAYKKLIALRESIEKNPSKTQPSNELCASITQALSDDLNTPKALGLIFEHLSTIKQDSSLCAWIVQILQSIFGLTLEPIDVASEITPEIAQLLQAREEARQNKDWGMADILRAKLAELGYKVQDKKA
jgi:cysteinyl-tRNA synthetase